MYLITCMYFIITKNIETESKIRICGIFLMIFKQSLNFIAKKGLGIFIGNRTAKEGKAAIIFLSKKLIFYLSTLVRKFAPTQSSPKYRAEAPGSGSVTREVTPNI